MEKPNFIDQELKELARLSLENERGNLSRDQKKLLERRLSHHVVYEEKIQYLIQEIKNKNN